MAKFRNIREIKQYEVMIQVAKMYFLENLSQQEIAETLNMSRSNISRILTACKDEGIVEVRIHENLLRTQEIKNALIDRFGIKSAVIAPHGNENMDVLDSVGKIAANYVEDLLTDDQTIGIGWGTTIYHLVSLMKSGAYHQMHIVQLIGGTGISEVYKDGVQLVFDFSRKTGGIPHILNAPLLVSSKKIRDLFIEENAIKQHLEMSTAIDVALVTIGTNDPDTSTMVSAGYLSREQSRQLCDEGFFTHILGQHIDAHGRQGKTALNDRIVGISLNAFKQIPLRVGIACGEFKARQIAAALAGGYINVLITDEITALQVERYSAESKLGRKG